MSDELQTPSTPAPTPAPAAPDDRQVLLEERQNERKAFQAQLQERDAQLASVIRERDLFKKSVGDLEPKAKLADELQVKVEGFINAGREGAILDQLKTALPGVEPLAIQGVLARLSEQGKAHRYAEDTTSEVQKILALIKQEAPGLTRPPTMAAGSSIIRPQPGGSEKTGYKGPFSH